MSPLPLLTAAFVLGLLAGRSDLTTAAVTVALVLLAGAGLAGARQRSVGAVALVLAAALVGFARTPELRVTVPRARGEQREEEVSGRVEQGCVSDVERAHCRVRTDEGEIIALSTPAGRCRARPGDSVRAPARVKTLLPASNGARLGPGASLWLRGVDATASAPGCSVREGEVTLLDRARRIGMALREGLSRGLSASLNATAAGRARALLFGDTTALGATELDAFRDSGLAHLLAVSGAHVALLAGLFGALCASVARRIASLANRGLVALVAALVSLPALAVFVLATGESPSAVRALVGATLGAFATSAGRKTHGESVVAASALVTLAAMPALVLDVGWQLSVVAAWALAVRSGPHDPPAAQGTARAVARMILGGIVTSARVAIAATPVLAWHFQRAPLSAITINALAAPLAETLALPMTLAIGALGVLAPRLGHVAGLALSPLLSVLFAMPRAALALPGASLSVPPPTPAQAVLAVAAALFALRFGARGRLAVLALAVLAIAGLELNHRARAHPLGALRVTAIDVGQGDALLIDLPDGAAMLIDGGGDRPDAPDPGARMVVPLLADRRRRALAVVVASHPHPDHVGGLTAVLQWAQVGELWDNRQGEASEQGPAYARMRSVARERGVVVRGPESLCGPPRPFHGAVLEVLAPCPAADPRAPPNDASFVLRLTFERASVVLPGDLERAGEERLLARMHGPVTLLKLGHHGSRTSSTAAWLDALRPRVALVSAGHPSPFDHPHEEVLARLAARAIPVYGTPEFGAVAVTLYANGSYAVEHGDELP